MNTILKILKSNKVQHSEEAGAAGFTLIEVLVSIAIVSIVLGAIFGMFNGLSRSYTQQDVISGVQQSLRGGLAIMTKDIRMAGFDPMDFDLFGIELASTTKIRLTSDTDMDGAVDDSNFERISYDFDAGDNQLEQILYEGTGSVSTQPVIENVTILTFTYLDTNGNTIGGLPLTTLAACAAIRSVVIDMTVQEDAGRAGPVTRTLTTRVRLRNLGV